MLLSDVRLAERWYADETQWKRFLKEGRKQWHMWAFTLEEIVAFVLDLSRAALVPLKTLFNLALYEAEAGLHLNTMSIQSDADQMKK